MTNDIIGNILRVLYDGLFWARNLSEGGRERPLLVVMEEAHSSLVLLSQKAAIGRNLSEVSSAAEVEGCGYG